MDALGMPAFIIMVIPPIMMITMLTSLYSQKITCIQCRLWEEFIGAFVVDQGPFFQTIQTTVMANRNIRLMMTLSFPVSLKGADEYNAVSKVMPTTTITPIHIFFNTLYIQEISRLITFPFLNYRTVVFGSRRHKSSPKASPERDHRSSCAGG